MIGKADAEVMTLAGIRRYVFARHSHPVSAWSRLLTTPLLMVPFWTRAWGPSLAVAAWFAVNPVMTPEPQQRTALSTRAMLGEELWSQDPGQDVPLIGLNVAGSVALGGAAVAAWRRRGAWTALACLASMAVTVTSWTRYAAIHDRSVGTDG